MGIVKRISFLLAPVFLLFFSFGCEKLGLGTKKATPEAKAPAAVFKGTAVAKVNNIPITLEELNKYIDVYNASIDLREDLTPEQKKEARIEGRERKINYLKDALVRQYVFYQAALDRGLDRRQDIVELLERNKIILLAQQMENDIIKNIEVSSAEIEELYNANKELFKEPESRKIREIVTKTEEEARGALRELLDPNADFVGLAKARSIAESAKDGGDLGYIRRGQRGEQFAAFDDMAFSSALQEGSISSVFKGPQGYYILKVEKIKEGKQRSLSEVWDVLKQLRLAAKQTEELNKAYEQLARDPKIKIELYENEIKDTEVK